MSVIETRLQRFRRTAITAFNTIDECHVMWAVDWGPTSRRAFQIVSAHCGHWGHLNWYDEPLTSDDMTEFCGVPLTAETPEPILLAALDGLAQCDGRGITARHSVALDGNLGEKTRMRHDTVLDELESLAASKVGRPLRGCSVAVAGYFRDLVETHSSRFGRLRWNDWALEGILLEPSADDDVVVVSGTALLNGSMQRILSAARQRGAATAVLSESLPSLAPVVLEGECDVLLSEKFPYFFLDGQSRLLIYRWY